MTEAAGIFIKKAECGQEVSRGDVLAQIMMKADSGEIISESKSTNRWYHFLRGNKAGCLFKSFGISDNQEDSSVKNSGKFLNFFRRFLLRNSWFSEETDIKP